MFSTSFGVKTKTDLGISFLKRHNFHLSVWFFSIWFHSSSTVHMICMPLKIISYLDSLLSIGRDGQLHTSIYDNRDYFNFHIIILPFLSSNIASSPNYGGFISQLILYARVCSSYECFILRIRRLFSKLLKQGYLFERLKSSFRNVYGRYGDLTQQYEVSLSRMINYTLTLDQLHTFLQFHDIDTELDLHRITSGFHWAFATDVACQQGTLTLPDTSFCPDFVDLLMLQLLRPDFPQCLFPTLDLWYPSVLSPSCFVISFKSFTPYLTSIASLREASMNHSAQFYYRHD